MSLQIQVLSKEIPEHVKRRLKHHCRQLWYNQEKEIIWSSLTNEEKDMWLSEWGNKISTEGYQVILHLHKDTEEGGVIFGMEIFRSSSSLSKEKESPALASTEMMSMMTTNYRKRLTEKLHYLEKKRRGQTDRAWDMYYQLLSQHPESHSFLPNPSIIRQQKSLFEPLLSAVSSTSSTRQLMGFQDYLNLCLSST